MIRSEDAVHNAVISALLTELHKGHDRLELVVSMPLDESKTVPSATSLTLNGSPTPVPNSVAEFISALCECHRRLHLSWETVRYVVGPGPDSMLDVDVEFIQCAGGGG